MSDPARPVETNTAHGTTVPDARVEAAMDAFYPGEDWRTALGVALPNSLRDMRAAIVAADALRAQEAAPPAGSAGDDETGMREKLWDALDLVLPMARGYAAAHPVGANARKIEIAEATLEIAAPPVDGAAKSLSLNRLAALAHQPPKAETPAGMGVPAGWQLVPVEATEKMFQAGLDAPGDKRPLDWERKDVPEYMPWVWTAMLRAAPAAPALAPAARTGDGVALADVAAERRRQIEGEGWTPEHDDTHSAGELAAAASCYALATVDGRKSKMLWLTRTQIPLSWPWDAKWWKRGPARRDLVKAGALIIAEIERLDRAALTAAPVANGEVV